MEPIRAGGCQCGAIRYEIAGAPTVVYTCHCRECQRQSGSAFAMAMVVPRDRFRITRGTPKSFARTAESGRRVVGWFCPDCGTRLYHTPGELGQNCNVKPGTLDDTSWLRPSVHCWTRSRQPWVVLAADAATYETQPEDRSWLLPPTTEPPA